MNWRNVLLLISIVEGARLWRQGGHGKKWARMLVFPALIAIVKFILEGWWTAPMNWLALAYAPILWGLLSLFSYGVDAPIHNFWEWVWGDGQSGNNRGVEMCTRGTCGFFWSFAAVPFVFVTGQWEALIGYILFLTFANAFIGGTIKDVEISERLVGASVALALLV